MSVVNDPTDPGLRWQSVTVAQLYTVMAGMMTMPVMSAVMSVAIEIALVLFAPSALVSVVAMAIVMFSIPLMLLMVPGLVMVPIITVVAVMGLQELFLVARRQGISPIMVLLPALPTAVIVVGHHRSGSNQERHYQASDQQSLHDASPFLFRDRSCIRTQCRMPLSPDYRIGSECQCPKAGFAGSLPKALST
tara:strand:- start:3015 stop:3590 length:576 start_codon:yes stop_codon:yes gene_type:complete